MGRSNDDGENSGSGVSSDSVKERNKMESNLAAKGCREFIKLDKQYKQGAITQDELNDLQRELFREYNEGTGEKPFLTREEFSVRCQNCHTRDY